MSHLSADRLAALGDDEPTSIEAVHLAACAACAHERAAYRTLMSMAHAERDSFGLPLTRWESIASAIGSTGVTVSHSATDTAGVAPRMPVARGMFASRPRAATWNRPPLQIAAGLLLVVGGMMAGRISVGAPPLPVGDGAPRVAASTPAPDAASGDATGFASIEEARLAQQRSEAVYQQAAAFLARHDSSTEGSPVAYRSRLAALDQMISSAREAMRQAPHDPVINDYYITTVGQREATLRQLNTVLPVSLQANSF